MTAEESCDYVVKTTNENLTVPRHVSVQVDCKVQTSPLKEDTIFLFKPDVNLQWAEGVELCEAKEWCFTLHYS